MLPIDSAGERLYRGFCRKTGYGAALDALRGARDDIYGLYMSEARLDARRRANALSWLNELFDQIAVPGDAERFLAETCRSLG